MVPAVVSVVVSMVVSVWSVLLTPQHQTVSGGVTWWLLVVFTIFHMQKSSSLAVILLRRPMTGIMNVCFVQVSNIYRV
jgi:hypothetical protein